ncbi:MAG: helicase-related protein [Spirochaetota bacterium]
MQPKDLPVYQERNKILSTLADNQVIVVESPTGSGKTTQLPIILYEAGYAQQGMIGVTQPRRIATLSVSDYIAKQYQSEIPGLVGYKMRFRDKTVPETKLKIMTDGILLQELKADSLLTKYTTIIVDEAHERSLNIDFILGLLKEILQQRPDFKLIISSATINPTIFSEYFDGCPIIHIDAKIYPIKTLYTPPENPDDRFSIYEAITDILKKRQQRSVPGDVLIFLPGEKMIKECMQTIFSYSFSQDLFVIPLYGRLPREDQEQVFVETPEGKTKVVVATNIAETSITIDNITTVIDSGLAKLNFYNPSTFTSSLIESPISKASANQRKGRSGRTAPGYCFRLYSKKEFENRPMFTQEEIKRTDLSEVVLRMAELGIHNFESFDFITPPESEDIISAVQTLKLLDAIDNENRLTPVGHMMSEFPLLPRHSRMIVAAVYDYPDVLEETLIAAAFLSSRSPFTLPVGEEVESRRQHAKFSDSYGDFVSYLKLYRRYITCQTDPEKEEFCKTFYLDYQTMEEIVHIVEQLTDIVTELEIPLGQGGSVHNYLCAVSRGLIQFVCVRTGRGEYRSLTAERIFIHPGSMMFKESPYYIVAGEIVKTSRTFARSVSLLKKEWIQEIYPQFFPQIGTQKKAGKPQKQRKSAAAKDTQHEQIISDQEAERIFLYDDLYEIVPYKGNKKLIIIPLEKLEKLYQNYGRSPKSIRNYRVKIVYNGLELHAGDRLASVMKIVPYLKPELGIYNKPPEGTFQAHSQLSLLADNLINLLAFCKMKKKKKTLGFIALDTNNNGEYWFKVVKSFHTAIDMSLYGLQSLMDELANLENPDKEAAANITKMYRTISTIYEQY